MALSDYGIIESLGPSGGWRYEQRYAGGIQRIPPSGSAGSARLLVEAVRLFRAQNNIELGDYEREVADYIKSASPQNNRFPGRNPIPVSQPKKPGFNPLIKRIGDWLAVIWNRKPKLVSETIARERASNCTDCPQNVRWETECGPCNENIHHRSKSARRRASFEMDNQLLGCRLHGIHLPCAVFLDRDFLPARDPSAPTFCWLP